MIDSKEITIIVQGPIEKNGSTKLCLEVLRGLFPQSEIILSTWVGSDTKDLNVDLIILNEDPGAVQHDLTNKLSNNLNRQLVSTQNGLRNSTRKYALKTRTDILFRNSNFLNCWNEFSNRMERFSIFEKKIIISSLFTRIEADGYLLPYHISDWLFFGLTSDLKKYFLDTSQVKEPEFSHFFFNNKNTERAYPSAGWQYPPEQYMGISCFKNKFPEIKMSSYAEANAKDGELSKDIIMSNFIILDPDQWTIESTKENYKEITRHLYKFYRHDFKSLYRNHIFQNDYREYFQINSYGHTDTSNIKNIFFECYVRTIQIIGIIFFLPKLRKIPVIHTRLVKIKQAFLAFIFKIIDLLK